MIEKEQREAERRPITKITHKGEIEIESQEPVKATEPAEVRSTSNITVYLTVKCRVLNFFFFPLASLSLLPKWQKSQQNLQKRLRKNQKAPKWKKTLPTNTSLTYLTYTARSAQVHPDARKKNNHLRHYTLPLLPHFSAYNVSLSPVTYLCCFFFPQ